MNWHAKDLRAFLQNFVLIVPDADAAEVRHQDDNGCIFVTSHVSEEQIQLLQQGAAQAEPAQGRPNNWR